MVWFFPTSSNSSHTTVPFVLQAHWLPFLTVLCSLLIQSICMCFPAAKTLIILQVCLKASPNPQTRRKLGLFGNHPGPLSFLLLPWHFPPIERVGVKEGLRRVLKVWNSCSGSGQRGELGSSRKTPYIIVDRRGLAIAMGASHRGRFTALPSAASTAPELT